MTDCKHDNGVFTHDIDLVNEEQIQTALQYGNLQYLQQIENLSAIRKVMISMFWCPECYAVYGEILGAD